MGVVNPNFGSGDLHKVEQKAPNFSEKINTYIKGRFQKLQEAWNKAYTSLTGRVSVEIVDANGKVEKVFRGYLSSLGLSKGEYFAAQKAGKEGAVIKHALEGNASILHRNQAGEITLVKRVDLQGLGISREEFLSAKKAGRGKELIQSAQEAFKQQEIPAETIRKAIKVSSGQFALALKADVEDDIRLVADKDDVWIRKKDHKIEVWKREAGAAPDAVQKIQRVGDNAVAFTKNTKYLDNNSNLPAIQKEKELIEKFSSVGVAVEGGVTVTGFDDEGYEVNVPDIGFVMEAGKTVYSEECNQVPEPGALDKEGKELTELLDKMHAFGTHNDIKPENIVTTEKGELRFIDFGGATLNGTKEWVSIDLSPRYVRAADRIALGDLNSETPKNVNEFDQLRKAIDIHQMGVTLYLRAKGKGVEDDSNLPYKLSDKPIDSGYHPEGGLKDPLFTEEDNVSPKMEKLIRAMLTEDPVERVQAYNQAKQEL